MSATFGQHELWQQHIQIQLQLQQQQEQQQAAGNRKRVLATEADEFMGIKKRNLGTDAAAQGIYGLGGFEGLAGANSNNTAATSSPFPGLGASPSTSASPMAGGFLTPTMATSASDRDYFGLTPTSQPNQHTSTSFLVTSRQGSNTPCNSSSAPATPSVGFSSSSSASHLSASSASQQQHFGWSNGSDVLSTSGCGGALSNPSTPVTDMTATMLSQNSLTLQHMEEQQRHTEAAQREEKQSLQRTQQLEQQSLHATQQRELQELHRIQTEQAFELAQSHHQTMPTAGVSSYVEHFNQQQQQQGHVQQQTMDMDQAVSAQVSNVHHDNNDPATWGSYDQPSSLQLRGYLSGQGRGYTPAPMGVAALAAAATMAHNQRSLQRTPPLVAPTDQHRQFDEGVGMDMDMSDGAGPRTLFDASEQEAMMQSMMMNSITTLHSSTPFDSPPSSASNAVQTSVPSFSSVSPSSSSFLPSTVFPTLGQEPLSGSPLHTAVTSFSMMMVDTSTSLQAQGPESFHHHHRHTSDNHHDPQRSPTTPTPSLPLTPTPTPTLSTSSPSFCTFSQHHPAAMATVSTVTAARSNHCPSLLLTSALLDKPSPPASLPSLTATGTPRTTVSAPNTRPSTPHLSTSQFQYVMGFRADCERCQRREKGHVAHLVAKESSMH